MTSNFEAQMDRKMGVDAPMRGDARPGDDTESAEERQFDELAEVMRGALGDARLAVAATRAALLFFERKDREVCGAAMAEAQAGKVTPWSGAVEASDRMMESFGRVWGARDARLSMGCFLLAMDRAPLGVGSWRDLAARVGVSVEKVRMEVDAHQSILGLPRTKAQKSAAALKSYKRTNGAKWKPGVN